MRSGQAGNDSLGRARSWPLAAAGGLLLCLCSCGGSEPSARRESSGAAGGASGTGGGATGGAAGVSGGAAGSAGGTGGRAAGGTGGDAGARPTDGGAGDTDGGTDAPDAHGSGGADASDARAGDARASIYNPCPTNGDACRIMPLGDSITDGCCGENTLSMGASYRLELFQLSLDHGTKLTFVGSHASGPNTVDNVVFPKNQEGHPGWTIADGGGRDGLQKDVAGWLTATPPDIITLMIGTNDVGIQLDLANAPNRLGVLIDTITKTAPKALVIVAQIVPTGTDSTNQRVRTYNAAMPALVKSFADAGRHVSLVDMYGAFTANPSFKTALLANDLHPSDAGYSTMANVWWGALGDLLPKR
jgi:lysophospholipase L1-like esterase